MDDVCCLLGICCPPFSDKQKVEYHKAVLAGVKGDAEKAQRIVDDTYDDFARMTEKIHGAAN
jgi:hypothetical protein